MYLKVMLTLLVILEAAAAAALWRAAGPGPGTTYYTDAEVAAGLDRRVGAVRVRDVTLAEAVERLASAAGTRVVFEEGVLKSMGWSPDDTLEMDLDLDDVPLSAALAVVLDPLVIRPGEDGTVRVSPRDHAGGDHVIRAYDVGPLVDALTRGSDDGKAREEAILALTYVTAAENGFEYDFELAGSAYMVGDVIVVVHAPAMHRRIERFLASLRAAVREVGRG
jgi:hypothetical protein